MYMGDVVTAEWLSRPARRVPTPTWHCKDCGAPQYGDKGFAITTKGRCLKCFDKSDDGKKLQEFIDSEFRKVMGHD
jgi:hypothetical protein